MFSVLHLMDLLLQKRVSETKKALPVPYVLHKTLNCTKLIVFKPN